MKAPGKNKPLAIVLGGTVPHISLLENLRRRGYHTILVDYFENPPAKGAADEHIQGSIFDRELVLELAKNRKAELVIGTCIDHAIIIACYVSEKLGLPAPYDYETARLVTNKRLMKKRMMEHGIPTSKYFHLKAVNGFQKGDLEFPVIVKPVDSNSSKGVRKASDFDEFKVFLGKALEISEDGEAIVEEFREGVEIGIDAFVSNGEAEIIMTRDKWKIEGVEDPIQQIHGCIWPASLTPEQFKELKKISTQIARAFELDNTPLMIQAIINGDRIDIIEFCARIGGGENFRIVRLGTGFDIIDASVESFLGRPVTLDYSSAEQYYVTSFIYAQPGLFGCVSGIDELVRDGSVEYFEQYKAKGARIGADLSSNNRIGVFGLKAETRAGLFDKARKIVQQIDILDLDGNSIMRRDIY